MGRISFLSGHKHPEVDVEIILFRNSAHRMPSRATLEYAQTYRTSRGVQVMFVRQRAYWLPFAPIRCEFEVVT